MSTIRKQSIISSIVVYIGFALGLVNTYLFTRKGGFTEEQYGLTATFIALASIMYAVAGVGMPGFISKFFPYYNAHTEPRKNDQLTWALLLPCLGFVLVLILGIAFKGIVVDKIFDNSPQLPHYYYWTFPFGFGYTIFLVLEAYAWQQRKSVLSNFLKEVVFRFLVTIMIVLTVLGLIPDFDHFIAIYAFLYIAIASYLVVHFYRKKQLYLHFSVSKVTRRFKSKIKTLIGFIWAGGLVFNVATVFDSIVIAAVVPNGMAAVGIFSLAQNISSLMQAPQRAVISAAVGPLSQAWKDKNMDKINQIYHRSSINQLIFAVAMFCLIWLNFIDGVETFHLRDTYKGALWVFFFLGLSKIIDMGTGLNAQIIGTSTNWRFEFTSGLVLLGLMLPLNYILTIKYGIIGPAISNLIAFTVYNAIRYFYLYRKFGMQPFTWATLLTLVLGAAAYFVSYLLFRNKTGFEWIVLRSATFSILFLGGVWGLKLSPDLQPVMTTLVKRLRGTRSASTN